MPHTHKLTEKGAALREQQEKQHSHPKRWKKTNKTSLVMCMAQPGPKAPAWAWLDLALAYNKYKLGPARGPMADSIRKMG